MKFHAIEMMGNLILEKLSSLPSFTLSRDKARLIYDSNENKLKYGDNTKWRTLYRDTDFDVDFAAKTSDDLTEGNTNLYFNMGHVVYLNTTGVNGISGSNSEYTVSFDSLSDSYNLDGRILVNASKNRFTLSPSYYKLSYSIDTNLNQNVLSDDFTTSSELNIMFIIDSSGSMDDGIIIGDIVNLIEYYEAQGLTLAVRLVRMDSNANSNWDVGGTWLSATEAKTELNSWSYIYNYTYINDTINASQSIWYIGTSNFLPNGQNRIVLVTDGGVDNPLTIAEQNDWQTFLENNNAISTAYSESTPDVSLDEVGYNAITNSTIPAYVTGLPMLEDLINNIFLLNMNTSYIGEAKAWIKNITTNSKIEHSETSTIIDEGSNILTFNFPINITGTTEIELHMSTKYQVNLNRAVLAIEAI